MLARLRSLFIALTARQDFERGMADEVRFHIEQHAAELIKSGISVEEARRRASMEFGFVNTVMGECRNSRGLRLFDEAARQLRYTLRLLGRSRGFTAAAILTISICVGANLAIFSAIDSILLRPLPFPEEGRLVTMFNEYPNVAVNRDGSSITNYYERRGRIPALASLSVYRFGTATIGEPGHVVREDITQVSPEFFVTLGLGPARGRSFTEQEMSYQADNAVILSYDYWRKHFTSDAIGRQIRVNGSLKTVVGILPAGFRFLSSTAQLYLPLMSRPEDRTPLRRHSGGNVTQIIARLRPTATLAEAQAQIDAQNSSLAVNDPFGNLPAISGFRTLVVPLHLDHVASVRPILFLLQASVFTLLLIGTVNLANLLLIRATSRAKEVAVRQTIGASRLFILSELSVETMLLTLAGSALGTVIGAAGIRLLAALGANRLPLGASIGFNAHSAMAALAVSVAVGFALTLPVAWFHLRDRGSAIGSESRNVTRNRSAQALRHAFVVAQISLAFVLLAGSGLLALSLRHAMDVFPGFRSDHVLTAQISLFGNRYATNKTAFVFADTLVTELERQPGVISAGLVNNIPFSGNNGKSSATPKGFVLGKSEIPHGRYSYGVSGNYFQAMGLVLRAGRFLTSDDSRTGRRVCVVDEDLARYYWPGANPLGQSLFQGVKVGRDSEAFTVVGVVGPVKQSGYTDEDAMGALYYPSVFYRRGDSNFVVIRSSVAPDSMRLTLEKLVREIDPELAVSDVKPMDDRMSESLLTHRSPTLLAALFSAVALVLTGLGTYGVLSYTVTQRRREIGIRMALGAGPNQIRRGFLVLILRLFSIALALGAVGAWLTGKSMRAIVFHVPSFSLPVCALAAVVMAAISIVACLLPAYRASRILPSQVLSEM